MADRVTALLDEARRQADLAAERDDPAEFKRWLAGLAQGAQSINAAAATPLIRIIQRRSQEERADVIEALLQCPPTETTLIGILQGRARWLENVGAWIREAVEMAQQEAETASMLYDAETAETPD